MNRLMAINFVLTGVILGTLLTWACGGDAPDANASQHCDQWMTRGFMPETIRWTSVQTVDWNGSSESYRLPSFDGFTLPEGWEPIGGEGLGAIVARRCVAY